MDDHNKEDGTETNWDRDHLDPQPSGSTSIWLVIVALLFLATAVIGGTYAYQQHTTISGLTVENQSMHSAMDQMRTQMNALTDKINQLAAPPAPAAVAAVAPAGSTDSAVTKNAVRSAAKRPAVSRPTAEDRRIKALQAQVDDQKKQLTETQGQLATATSDLNDRLSSDA